MFLKNVLTQKQLFTTIKSPGVLWNKVENHTTRYYEGGIKLYYNMREQMTELLAPPLK